MWGKADRNAQGVMNYALIAVCVVAAAVFFFLRNYYHTPVSDDLLYGFVQGRNMLGAEPLDRPVHTIGDAIESQNNQYFYSNGRFPVHLLVQMFAGPWRGMPFCIVNAMMLAAAIVLVVRYCFSAQLRSRFWPWMLTVLSILYLYPGNSYAWYSIAGTFNYLYPLILATLFLAMFDKLASGDRFSGWGIAGMSLLSFLMGWCQECYSIPLAGAVFFYVMSNIRRCRGRVWLVSVMLWAGTALLVFAPGNFARASASKNVVTMMGQAVGYFLSTYSFWAFLLLLLWLRIKNKTSVGSFIRDNRIIVYAWAIACAMGCVVNTLPQSFYGISFFSTLLAMRILPWCFKNSGSRWPDMVAIVIFCFFVVHQTMVVVAEKKVDDFHKEFIKAFIESPDGVVVQPEPPARNPLAIPYAQTWFERYASQWTLWTVGKYYGKDNKPLVCLRQDDYEAYCDIAGRYGSLPAVCGDSRLRRAGEYIWTHDGNFNKGDKLVVTSITPVPYVKDRFINILRYIKGEKPIISMQTMEIFPGDSTLLPATPGYRAVMHMPQEIVSVEMAADVKKRGGN